MANKPTRLTTLLATAAVAGSTFGMQSNAYAEDAPEQEAHVTATANTSTSSNEGFSISGERRLTAEERIRLHNERAERPEQIRVPFVSLRNADRAKQDENKPEAERRPALTTADVVETAAYDSNRNDGVTIVYYSNGSTSEHDPEDRKIYEQVYLAAQQMIFDGVPVERIIIADPRDDLRRVVATKDDAIQGLFNRVLDLTDQSAENRDYVEVFAAGISIHDELLPKVDTVRDELLKDVPSKYEQVLERLAEIEAEKERTTALAANDRSPD